MNEIWESRWNESFNERIQRIDQENKEVYKKYPNARLVQDAISHDELNHSLWIIGRIHFTTRELVKLD